MEKKILQRKKKNFDKCSTIVLCLFIMILSLLTPSSSYSFGSWNQETTARELCFLFSLSTDWKQTLEISKNPDKYSETNPILGDHPDESKVHTYFATCALIHAFVAYMLPPEYSKIWQVTWIGIQSSVTDSNKDNGIDKDINMEYSISFSVPF
jgi:hypothetical protein